MGFTNGELLSGIGIIVSLGWNLFNSFRTTTVSWNARHFDEFKQNIRGPLCSVLQKLDENTDELSRVRTSVVNLRQKRKEAASVSQQSLRIGRSLTSTLNAAEASTNDRDGWINKDSEFREKQSESVNALDAASDIDELNEALQEMEDAQRKVSRDLRQLLSEKAAIYLR